MKKILKPLVVLGLVAISGGGSVRAETAAAKTDSVHWKCTFVGSTCVEEPEKRSQAAEVAVTAMREKAVQDLQAFYKVFLAETSAYCASTSDEKKNEALCKFVDDTDSQLQCFVDDVGLEGDVIQCDRNAGIEETSTGYHGSIFAGFEIFKKLLRIVAIEATFDHTVKITKRIWECENLESGDIYTGTPKEISEQFREYLEKRKGED